MKHMKKLLPLVLVMCLSMALIFPVNAAGVTPYTDANGNQFEFVWNTGTESWTLNKFTPGSNPRNIVIPSAVDGKPVKTIRYLAFANQADIETVQLPDTLTSIEARAFWNCTGLVKVDIPNSVIYLGGKTLEEGNTGLAGQVFAGCTSLKDISLGTGAADFFRAFEGTAVETATVPNTVNSSLNAQNNKIMPYKYQTYGMYLNCKSLKTAYVESGVRDLEATFGGCTALEALYLPKTVADLRDTFGKLDHPIHIYYEGSQADFAKVKVSKEFGAFAKVHYNSYTPVVFAADRSRNSLVAAKILHDLGLFNGVGNDPSGNPIYALDRAPTRNEAVTMLVRLLGKEEEAQSGVWVTPFTDLTEWAKPYVGYAYAHGLTIGVSDTHFGGGSTVTREQYATFILRALGYTSGVDFQWNDPWALMLNTGAMLTDSIYWVPWCADIDPTPVFRREDVALMSFLSLTAKVKGTDIPLIEKVMDGSSLHSHSFHTYTLPSYGGYKNVPVTQNKEYCIESHCNSCGYITYDTDDLRQHQFIVGGSGQTFPDSTHGINRPWYSQVREWTKYIPEGTLRVCTVCGKAA